MEIQIFKQKLKIQFSIFNFSNRKLDNILMLHFYLSNNIWNCVERGKFNHFFAEENRK